MAKGYVYILTNPSFKEDWVKIGKTAKTVEERCEELFTTALPTRFDIYAWVKTSKFNELEKQMHHILDRLTDYRIADNREFFQIVPSEAFNVLKELSATIDDAEIYNRFDNETAEPTKQAPPFKFSMVNIKPGDKIVFEPTGTVVTVIESKTDNKIEYKGEKYTTSGFCKAFMPDNKRNSKDAYQGPKFFSFNGKILDTLRNESDN